MAVSAAIFYIYLLIDLKHSKIDNDYKGRTERAKREKKGIIG